MKKIIKAMSYISTISGLLLALGTAGKSDIGAISLGDLLRQLLVAFILLALGALFSAISENKKQYTGGKR